MNRCEAMEALLNDRLDGLLDTAGEARAAAHLEGCSACRRAWEGLRALREETAALPRQVDPPPGLWRQVSDRLEPGGADARGTFWASPRAWALAATAAAAGVLITLAVQMTGDRATVAPGPPRPGDPAGVSAVSSAGATGAVEAFLAAEELYRKAGRQLQDALEAAGAQLPPESRATIESHLALIDASIQEVRAALQAHPERPDYGYRLVELHRRRLGLLEQTTRILRGHAGSSSDKEVST